MHMHIQDGSRKHSYIAIIILRAYIDIVDYDKTIFHLQKEMENSFIIICDTNIHIYIYIVLYIYNI